MSHEEMTGLSASTSTLNGQISHTTPPAAPTLADIHNTLTSPGVMQSLMGFEANDRGNALAVQSVFGTHVLFSEALGWLYYTGTHWEREEAAFQVLRAVTEVLHARYRRAGHHKNDELMRAAKPQASTIAHAMKLFCPLVQARVDDFDASPDHLNCANGVLNLREGSLEPHTPQQRFTYVLQTPYDPHADAVEWRTFLQQVIDGGAEVLSLLQQTVGYSLTGRTNEEKLFYLYGDPRAGKGVFTETLRTLIGSPLSTEVDFQTFTAERKNDSNNHDLAPLKPARFIVASESSKRDKLNAERIKVLTGGNSISCRHLYRSFFSYRPSFKIWLVSNNDVYADPHDRAVWGRIIRFVFPHSWLGQEDKTLKEQMKEPAYLQGVLAWAVEGAQQWYASPQGLQVPDVLKTALETVRAELDTVQEWLDLHTEPNAGGFEPYSKLFGSYKSWCKDNGQTSCSSKDFGDVLTKKGYRSDRKYLPNGKQDRCRMDLNLRVQ
jgi:putative DNA primase/helicase